MILIRCCYLIFSFSFSDPTPEADEDLKTQVAQDIENVKKKIDF